MWEPLPYFPRKNITRNVEISSNTGGTRKDTTLWTARAVTSKTKWLQNN